MELTEFLCKKLKYIKYRIAMNTVLKKNYINLMVMSEEKIGNFKTNRINKT